MSNPPRLPIVSAAGDMLPYLSASRRRRALDSVFEVIGGEERLAHEAGRSADAYWNFIKLWAKGPLAVTQNKTEHSVDTKSVEDLWAKLDARKKAAGRIHDDSIIDVTPQPDED
jgi:hypothetical protein